MLLFSYVNYWYASLQFVYVNCKNTLSQANLIWEMCICEPYGTRLVDNVIWFLNLEEINWMRSYESEALIRASFLLWREWGLCQTIIHSIKQYMNGSSSLLLSLICVNVSFASFHRKLEQKLAFFNYVYTIAICLILSYYVLNYNLIFLLIKLLVSSQVFWAFSIYLEAVAILPQLILLQRSGNVDNLTGQYVFLLGYF